MDNLDIKFQKDQQILKLLLLLTNLQEELQDLNDDELQKDQINTEEDPCRFLDLNRQSNSNQDPFEIKFTKNGHIIIGNQYICVHCGKIFSKSRQLGGHCQKQQHLSEKKVLDEKISEQQIEIILNYFKNLYQFII